MTIRVRLADLTNPEDTRQVHELINEYARHPMGQARDLDPEIQSRMIDGLAAHPTTLVFLAEPHQDGQTTARGVAVSFLGYSTFKAAPLINVHDLFVSEMARSQGVGGQLLDAVVEHGRKIGCCAVTLEVRSDNPARKLYEKKGFQGIAIDQDEQGEFQMLFGKRDLTKV